MTQVPTVTLNDGVTMPQLGFGVFLISPDDVVEPVRTAIEAGYRMIDTASAYQNEEGVGKAIAQAGVPREELFVITKVWNDDQGYDRTMRAFEASLQRLGLEYVDMYLIHWPRPRLNLYVETWQAMERLRSDGVIRSVGVSNFAPEQLTRLMSEGTVKPTVNQVECYPGFPQDDLRAFHAEHGIVTQAWSPIGRGQGLLERPEVTEMAAKHGRTPAQVVLRWHIQLGVVPLPKSVRPDRIRDNLAVFDFALDEADMTRLSAITGYRVGPDPATIFDIS